MRAKNVGALVDVGSARAHQHEEKRLARLKSHRRRPCADKSISHAVHVLAQPMPTPHRIFKTVAEVSWCVASFIPMPCSALSLSIFYGLPAFRLPAKVLAPARFNWAAHFESSRAADLT